MADLFFIVKNIDIASYPDDNTPFIVEDNIENVIASLEEATNALFGWFDNIRLKNNPDKCNALVSTNKHLNMKLCDYTIGNSQCEKLLGVKIDVNLNFNKDISDLCKKASRKISALARIAPFMSIEKRMDNMFKLRTENPYSLRQVSEFSRPIVKTVYHGTEVLHTWDQKYRIYCQKN